MFHSVRVQKIVEETPEAKSVVLDVPPGLQGDFRYRAGQFLTFEVEIGGERLRRSYSLASSPDWEGGHKVTVKRVDGGRVSCWFNDKLRVGDVLSVTKPEGRFVLDASTGPLVLFAGGSGITPVVSLVKTALKTTPRWVLLFYANRDARSVIFQAELAALEDANRNRMRIVHRLDDQHGLLDEATVRAVAQANPGASFYLCGPAPFMSLIEKTLPTMGVPEGHIHVERFISPPTRPAGQPAPAPAPTNGTAEIHGVHRDHPAPVRPRRSPTSAARRCSRRRPGRRPSTAPSCCDAEEGFVQSAAPRSCSRGRSSWPPTTR